MRLWIAVLLVACGEPDPAVTEGPSGASCPATQTLTYTNFAKGFFDTYCTRCHAVTKTGDDRLGAPADHNWDALAGIKIHLTDIDREAAAGPTRTNESMPAAGARPSLEDRKKLGEWIACGAPE